MIEVERKEDLDDVLAKNDRVLVLFYASWCPYCARFVPTFDKKIANFKAATVIHVLLDDYNNPLWDDLSIEAVPTVILFEKGKVCNRLDGRLGSGLSERQFLAWLEELN